MGDDAAVVDPLSTDRGALRRELEREVVAMGLCAAGAGQALPPDLLPILQTLDEATGQPSVEQLVAAHAALSELVQPAKPRSLAVLHRYGALDVRRRSFRGLPITRSLMVGAVVCLVAISALGMSPLVSADPAVSNPMLSSGLPLLVNLGFIMAIAMLGALFHELFIVSGHLTQGTYDPRYNTSYWARIVLGVISGVLLSWLIAIPSTSTMHGVGRPAMALVGGFSAGLVHRILERMVSAVESMFSSQLADLQGKQRAVDGQAERQATQQKRLEAASMLMDLQHGIGDGADPSEVRAKLRDAAQAMVSGRPSTPSTPSATVTPDPRGGEATGTRSMPSRLAASMPSNDESSSASVAGPASAADPGPVVARESMGESAPAADSRASNAVAASATPQPTAASAPAFASTAAVGPVPAAVPEPAVASGPGVAAATSAPPDVFAQPTAPIPVPAPVQRATEIAAAAPVQPFGPAPAAAPAPLAAPSAPVLPIDPTPAAALAPPAAPAATVPPIGPAPAVAPAPLAAPSAPVPPIDPTPAAAPAPPAAPASPTATVPPIDPTPAAVPAPPAAPASPAVTVPPIGPAPAVAPAPPAAAVPPIDPTPPAPPTAPPVAVPPIDPAPAAAPVPPAAPAPSVAPVPVAAPVPPAAPAPSVAPVPPAAPAPSVAPVPVAAPVPPGPGSPVAPSAPASPVAPTALAPDAPVTSGAAVPNDPLA